MVTFISFTSTGGRIGRIHWANTAPFRGGTIWGQVQWDRIWPATPQQVLTEQMRRILDTARILGEQMAQAIAPVGVAAAAAADALAELGRAFAAVGVEGGKIASPLRLASLERKGGAIDPTTDQRS
jgi:hypothetical protein